MSLYITNAAPMIRHLGTEDLSRTQPPREPEAIPQHCPKIYLYTRKGPTTPQLCGGAERVRMYGDETFDLLDKYANHATVFANLANAEGNACMYQRVIPDDAGPEATITFWLDVLETTVDLYERNEDGSIKLSPDGLPIITGNTTGYKCKWVTTNYETVSDVNTVFGSRTVMPGNQVDEKGTQSQRYPIFEFKASSKGEWANLKGIRIWPMTVTNTGNLPTKLMNEKRVYPFNLSVISKPTPNDTPTIEKTIMGDTVCTFVLKEGTIDPNSTAEKYLGNVFISSYNEQDETYPATIGSFNEIKIYQANIDNLLKKFHKAETPFIDEWSDFNTDEEDMYLFNPFTCTSTQGVPYHSVQLVDASDSIIFDSNTGVFAKGGSDGTMSNELFALLVEKELTRYLDEDDELMETAINVESIFYDSGFPLDTKFKIPYFISNRADTCVVLGTYEVDQPNLSNSEEYSAAIALRTRIQNFPESEYFGTSAMRGVIVGFSGRLKNSLYTGRLPLTAELLIKASRYMGASNGRWKSGSNFDGAPGSIINNMYDISTTWVPATVRNKFWSVGLNWVQAYGRRSFFFPAIKTVYPDDTSVLNSFNTVMAICQLNKIGDAVHREFSGVDHLSNTQLVERINAFVNNRVQGLFDNRYTIVPDCQITDEDALYGYRWTLDIKIYSPNMKTVQTFSVKSYRIDDLSS